MLSRSTPWKQTAIKETQITDSQGQSEFSITVYRARWVCPGDQPAIADGAIVVNNLEILSVGCFSRALDSVSMSNCQVIDLGEGVIIPGLVNTHTHLEFSDLEYPLGQPGINFTDWIRLIVSRRIESNQETGTTGSMNRKIAAIQRGIEESSESGVWAIGEIATMPVELDDYRNRPANMLLMCFLEQLGRDETAIPTREADLDAFFNQRGWVGSSPIQIGASPHAPYSVAPNLLRQICRQANAANRPVAMHLAETLAEREFVDHQTGEFVSLLQDFGVWNPGSPDSVLSIGETLKVLSSVPLSLIVHGNYLSDCELDFVSSCSERMSVAFCPRTHHFFGHSAYPLEKMLKRKINICLGTDSRASNPDLDLFEEAKFVANSFSRVDPRLILKMATLNGAHALGVTQAYGSLIAGKKPAMCLVTHPGADSGDSPFDWMFDRDSKCAPL